MKRARVIPVLLLKNKGLYKTVKFSKPNYIGDPVNAVKIFNDKEADELLVLDTEASVKGREPDYAYLKAICGEAFMPLAYGGGIKTLSQAAAVFQAGVEKVVLNSSVYDDLALISEIATAYGNQSTVACLDYKKKLIGGNRPCFLSAGKSRNITLSQLAKDYENAGAGEIILQSVDRDGTFSGLDLETIREVAAAVSVPVVACGGLNSLGNITEALRSGASAVAAGSFFVYKNNDPRSILINYPSDTEIAEISKQLYQ